MHVCVCLTGPAPPVLIVGEEAGPYHLVLSSITLIARPPVVHVSKNIWPAVTFLRVDPVQTDQDLGPMARFCFRGIGQNARTAKK